MTSRQIPLAFAVALGLFALLFWFLAFPDDSGTRGLTDDLNVYSTLLAYTADGQGPRQVQPSADILSPWRDDVRFLIHPSSSLPPLTHFTSTGYFTRLRRTLPNLRLSTWRDFLQQNRRSAPIPRALSSTIPFRFEIFRPEDVFNGPDSLLQRYRDPRCRAIFVFSRVGYSGSQALVHRSHSFDVAAFGAFLQLQRTRDGWRVVGNVPAEPTDDLNI